MPSKKPGAKKSQTKKETPEVSRDVLDSMSVSELRAYLAEREAANDSPGQPLDVVTSKPTRRETIQPRRSEPVGERFSVRETLNGKTVFIIGGTGFLGRLMLYVLLKYAPETKRIFVLIRPTHGRTGQDRFDREILESPVFTLKDGDREYFEKISKEKVTVVEGDAARDGLNLKDDEAQKIRDEAHVVLNTAGNVEFNPPVDLSLAANTMATRKVLDFVESTSCKKYVHISTCYVADRTVYPDRSPEKIVSKRIVTRDGNEIVIDPEREIDDALAVIESIKKSFDSADRERSFKEQARQELRRMGRDDVSDRLLDRTARNLKTLAVRDALISEGKDRAVRINRPNVYTYTKTLAELLVDSRRDRIQFTIVRPSIVETSVRHPFPAWNEGIQGSAPLMFLIHKGHRMLPSQSEDPTAKPHAVLDFIPVDEVAAGTILAMCALIREEQRDVYQVAAGPQPSPITGAFVLNIVQLRLRDMMMSEPPSVTRWLKLNLQSFPVTQKTFERFSSPRTLKFLERARERLERFEQDRLPPTGQRLFGRVQTGVERFYQISLLKNKIFQEFLPFFNEGYPVFENQNAIDLWKRLPAEEQEFFHFNPFEIDYIDYLSNEHFEAVTRWIFPVLEKRFNAIYKIGRDQEDKGSDAGMSEWRAVFAPGDVEFRDRLHILRKAAATTRERRKERRATIDGDAPARPEANRAGFVAQHFRAFAQDGEKSPGELAEESITKFSDHLEFVSGARISPDALRELNSVDRIRKRVEKWMQESEAQAPAGPLRLSPEGVELPDWFAKPTADFLYQVQMWFYRSMLDVEVNGHDNIPLNNNHVIIVANHASHLDYGLVWYSLGDYGRDLGILAARDYFFDKFIKSTFFGNLLPLIPIERGDGVGYQESLRHAFHFLNRGGPLLIFPEGTRSADGVMRPFRHGLGYLVHKSGADILPIRLHNTHKALPKGKTVVRSTKVRVQIGNIIPHQDLVHETEGMSPTRTYSHISKRLHEIVQGLDRHS